MGASGRIAELNPTAQVPTVEDGDFALYEMPAILIFLCEKHRWQDLFPTDLETRARVQQYLHFHHGWTRRVTMELMSTSFSSAACTTRRFTVTGYINAENWRRCSSVRSGA
jgi:glutathione S-transferase